MNKRNEAEQLNNRGFTLIEVMVATLILAVALVPLLHSFYVTADTNRKAKVKLRSTMVAQDVMEGLKGYHTEEIAEQFEHKQDFVLISNNAVGTSSNIAEISGDGSRYEFELKNLEYQSTKYDVQISLNAAPYKSGKVNLSGNAVAPNNDYMVDISAMDNAYDGIFMSDSEEADAEAMAELTDQNASSSSNQVNRVFTITLSNDGISGGKQKQRIKVYADYTDSVTGAHFCKEYNAYSNTLTVADDCYLRNMYFFYRPGYKYRSDTIIFTNYDEIPVKLLVIKQKPSATDTVANSMLYTNELSYGPKLTVKIKEAATTDINFRKTDIGCNLQNNLYDSSPVSGVKYYFNSGMTTAAALDADNLFTEKKENRMFDAVVTVYKEGAANAGFPEDMKLTSLDSSKINQ